MGRVTHEELDRRIRQTFDIEKRRLMVILMRSERRLQKWIVEMRQLLVANRSLLIRHLPTNAVGVRLLQIVGFRTHQLIRKLDAFCYRRCSFDVTGSHV